MGLKFESINVKIPKGSFVVRVDGKGFHKLTEHMGFNRPFDQIFHVAMKNVGWNIMKHSGTDPLLVYGQSDEISFLFHATNSKYNRRVEKWCSILASYAGMCFHRICSQDYFEENEMPEDLFTIFDARIIPLLTDQEILAYFQSRQHDAWRNCVSGYAFWTFVNGGGTRSNAAKYFNGMNIEGQIDYLLERGIKVWEQPKWQTQGWSLTWEYYQKWGFNPLTKERVVTSRRKIKEVKYIPDFNTDWGRNMIFKALEE